LPTSFVVKKRVEDLGLHVVGHARPIVVDLEHERLAIRRRATCARPACRAVGAEHGLLGVDHQVQQHLLQLMRVREDLRQARGQRVDDTMLVTRCSYARSDRVSRTTWLRSTIVRVLWRLRAKVSSCRTILAARSALVEDHVHARACRRRACALHRRFGHVRIVASGLLSSCATPGHGLAEGGHLFGLQQLLIEVARLVVELLPLADVAHQGVDAHGVRRVRRLGMRRHLQPDRRAVGAGARAAGSP
jgi:hypothetical protein